MTAKSEETIKRRTLLAEAVLQPDFTQAAFAELHGVSQATVSADIRSKEFLTARNGSLATKSLRVIEHHLDKNDRQTALFVAERLRLIEPEEGSQDSGAHEILAKLFAPGDQALRRENAELRERIQKLEDKTDGKTDIR